MQHKGWRETVWQSVWWSESHCVRGARVSKSNPRQIYNAFFKVPLKLLQQLNFKAYCLGCWEELL